MNQRQPQQKVPAPPPPRALDPVAGHEAALRTLLPSRDAILQEVRATSSRSRRRTLAATTALVMLACALIFALDPPLHPQHLQTAMGATGVWDLPDGSEMRLNTHSTAQVDMRLRSRRVALQSGEAFFSVAHEWRPFTVAHADFVVRDIGTRFRVRAEGGQLLVSVSQGAVQVHNRGEPRARRLLHAGDSVWMRAGRPPQAAVPEKEYERSWMAGKLSLENRPLAEVAAQVQRYRSGVITVDPAVAGHRLTAEYDLQGLDALIDALPSFLPVQIVHGPDGAVHIRALKKVS